MFIARGNKRLYAILIGCLLLLWGCASSFNPREVEDDAFQERAQTQEEKGIRVTAAVLSAQESVIKFGVNLYRRNIQPVWLEIQNSDSAPVWFLPVGLDPEHFTPLESSFFSRFAIRRADHDQMDQYFFKVGMGNYVAPGATVSGFVSTLR